MGIRRVGREGEKWLGRWEKETNRDDGKGRNETQDRVGI